MCSPWGATAPITTDWFWTEVEAVYRSHWGLLDGLEQASRG